MDRWEQTDSRNLEDRQHLKFFIKADVILISYYAISATSFSGQCLD